MTKVICIKNDDRPPDQYLTIGNIYYIINILPTCIEIIDDSNKLGIYRNDKFQLLSLNRMNKINKILE